MPRRPRPGNWRFLYAEVTPEEKARLEQAAKLDNRSVSAFLRQWIRTLPPLAPDANGIEKATRGRKKKNPENP